LVRVNILKALEVLKEAELLLDKRLYSQAKAALKEIRRNLEAELEERAREHLIFYRSERRM